MTEDVQNTPESGQSPRQPVWKFRGYELQPSEFNTAMVHYYRAEIARSNTWRMRLDTTTNWAVITLGAAITIAFSSPSNSFVVLILNALLVTLFLSIEARRYRYYELWSYRARLMETDFFAAMLVPPFSPHGGWAETLAETLLQPKFPISQWEAIGRRLRRNYLWIYLILTGALIFKLLIHPTAAGSLAELESRAAIGPIAGPTVFLLWLIFIGLLVVVALATSGLTDATGEILPKYAVPDFITELIPGSEGASLSSSWTSLKRRLHRRDQLLAFVVASNPEAVAQRIINEMARGVTALHGRGMYLNRERDVLTVALTVTEVEHLKRILQEEDEHAFMTVMPAREVIGEGFIPLKDDEA